MKHPPLRSIPLLFLVVSMTVAQQTDSTRSLEDELLSRPDSDAMLLSKTRDALRDAILRSDGARTAELAAFIRDRFDSSRYVPLWPREWMLVHYATGDYRRILDATHDPEETFSYRTKLTPQNDLFLQDVEGFAARQTPSWESRIRSRSFPPDDEAFLVLFLHYVTGPRAVDMESDAKFIDRLNAESDEMLAAHRDSPHNPFVRRYIRRVFVPSRWGGGLSFSVGPGTLSPNLGHHFTDPVLLEFTFDGAYQSFFGTFGLSIGAASPVHTSFVDTEGKVWQKDLKVNHLLVYLAAGIFVTDLGPLKLSPHAGIGFADISPPEKEREIPGNDVSLSAAALMLGLNIDIPIAKTSNFMTVFEEQGYWYVRVKPSWQRMMTSDPFLKGSMFSLTVGFGAFARPIERDF